MRALQSVHDQTYPNIEIIVVDDSSTEDLSSITNTFKNTRIIRNNVSRGAQKSRLRGTEESKGEFVALLDSDDWWEPEKLQKQYEAFLANNPSLVSCQVNITNELRSGIIVPKQVFSGGQVANFLFADHGILQTSTFFSKKEILEDLLRKSADTKVHNDPSVVIECEKARNRHRSITRGSDLLRFYRAWRPNITRPIKDRSIPRVVSPLWRQLE